MVEDFISVWKVLTFTRLQNWALEVRNIVRASSKQWKQHAERHNLICCYVRDLRTSTNERSGPMRAIMRRGDYFWDIWGSPSREVCERPDWSPARSPDKLSRHRSPPPPGWSWNTDQRLTRSLQAKNCVYILPITFSNF